MKENGCEKFIGLLGVPWETVAQAHYDDSFCTNTCIVRESISFLLWHAQGEHGFGRLACLS